LNFARNLIALHRELAVIPNSMTSSTQIVTLAPFGPFFGEAIYKNFATIKAALQEYARFNGFAISVP
jgi:hypothetical protein